MGKIGVMMSADRADGQMSSHFGKAEWIMVADTENPVLEFVKNTGLNGKNVVEIVSRQGCADVIFTDIGDGALGHLQVAHIRAWMFREGQLPPAPSARTATRQDARHGCCCSSRAGSESAACCRN